MSGPLAVGAVSAVLRNLLDNGMVEAGPAVGSVKVTAVAPDTIKLDDPNAGPSLNLFLYRVSPNQGWRNAMLPSRNADGAALTNPPLALDLHYLLTAYGTSDFHAEILLGYAMSVLHGRPVLDRAAIRRALDPSPLGGAILPPAFQALTASDLADQLEAVTVTLEPIDSEEMSRLWSAIQSHYRPSAGYLISVVLIEATTPTRTALPVLSRGAPDPVTGEEPGVFVHVGMLPPIPTVFGIELPPDRAAAHLGDTLRITGVHLDGTAVEVRFAHALLADPVVVPIGVNADASQVEVALPTGGAAEAAWPAGTWTVRVALLPPGDPVERQTNTAAFILAPEPVLAPPPTVTRDAVTGAVAVVLGIRPQVRASQRVTLALDGDVAGAEPHPTTTGTLTFRFGPVPDGDRRVRLTVDGAESLLVDRSTTPPSYDPTQKLAVPV
ncbi:MAG: DUF4255 domain-containing protein [Microbacterium sp.]